MYNLAIIILGFIYMVMFYLVVSISYKAVKKEYTQRRNQNIHKKRRESFRLIHGKKK